VRIQYCLGLFLAFLICGCKPGIKSLEPGVTYRLANARKADISNVQYEIKLDIPASKIESIHGTILISFDLARKGPLVLDFNADSTQLISVRIDSNQIPFSFENEHIQIQEKFITMGLNEVLLEFVAGDLSLNRNDDYLYTLFVPDRASTAFPCFDQPDIKARYQLTLTCPEGWKALSNAPLQSNENSDGFVTYYFGETKPISTYLFAFTAGVFYEQTQTVDGHTMRMLYRETDTLKVERNTADIFALHAQSLNWMSEYTQVKYPFQKFDFALIPTFQYGGMEHPGSIFYRESSLMLNESATLNDRLGRAGLIAHETAHIWFGDLVTMKWFDDVWAKEVFANFMSGKIVNQQFPQIHHDLKFLLRHHPAAYSVDRTRGTNAVKQPLGNLKQAGMLYGAIIYNKAPIMMKHLEELTGVEKFQEGMRDYIKVYKYDNADWKDLIEILDKKTDHDLHAWSKIWIETAGMPLYNYTIEENNLLITQSDAQGQSRVWPQTLNPLVLLKGVPELFEIEMNVQNGAISGINGDLILLNGAGSEYGAFILDETSINTISSTIHTINDRYLRGKIWLGVFESFLHGKITPTNYLHILEKALLMEQDKQIINLIIGQTRTVYWKFLTPSQRDFEAENIEKTLWDLLQVTGETDMKTTYFRAYVNVVTTPDGLDNLYRIWDGQAIVKDLPLGEREYNTIALELSVKGFEDADVITNLQLERILNPDRKQRFQFLLPSVSNQPVIRDQFFESLKDAQMREQEPWVISALYYLHHPLRSLESEKYLLESLELLEEIQVTGDIFFPKRWLDASFSGHQSAAAVNIVNQFLDDNPGYNKRLRDKILQSTDMLLRSSSIVAEGVNNSL